MQREGQDERKGLAVGEYLALPEQMTPQELVWGVVREAPAPFYGHQSVVGQVFARLDAHVRAHDLGTVCVSPVDVVLDARRALVVQPDVLFVSRPRLGIIRDQVWGAPDLVVEVASRRTRTRDKTTKLAWYRRYGVPEMWLVDPHARRIVIVDLTQTGRRAFHAFTGTDRLRSAVVPRLGIRAEHCFP